MAFVYVFYLRCIASTMSRLIVFTIAVVCLLGFGSAQLPKAYYLEGFANDIGSVAIWVDNSDTNTPKLKIRYPYADGTTYSAAIIGAFYYSWSIVNDTVVQCAESETLSTQDFQTFQEVLNTVRSHKNYQGAFIYNGQYTSMYTQSVGNQRSMTAGYDNLSGNPQFVTLVFRKPNNYMEFGLRIDAYSKMGSVDSTNVWNIPNGCMSS